jgi:adenine-specific DNA-methyltransferase
MDDRLAAAQRALGPPTVAAGSALLWQGDALKLLDRLPGGSVQLVVTSPPYNIGKPYEPRQTVEEYVAWCSRWLNQIARVLTPTGAAWVNVGYTSVPGRGVAVPIPYLLWPHLGELHLLQEVVWHQTNGVACRKRLSPRNEKLLWLVRDPSAYAFNLDAIRDPHVAYPQQRRQGRLRCNPLGKNPGDVWTIRRVVAGRSAPERTSHPAQMPLALAERLVLACSDPGDLVLDPLAGSASSLVAAQRLGRVGWGFELRSDYCDLAHARLTNLE